MSRVAAIRISGADLERTIFRGIVGLFVGLSLLYNVAVPAGEGVDEIPHLRFTLYVKDRRALPVVPFVAQPDTVLMGHHPPLYYILAATLIAPVDTSDLDKALPPNPHFVWIEGYGPGNRNVFLHSPISGTDPFPWRGVVLAIHLLRVASTLQGTAALIAVRALLVRLVAGQPVLALAGTASTAFQPTFISTFSLAHHDGTVALLCLLGILWCVDLVRRADLGKPLPSPLAGGAILGLAILTKTSAVALAPVYLLAWSIASGKLRQWRASLAGLGTVATVAVAISGWWYARNLFLYGDLFAQNVFAATHPSLLRTGPYRLGDGIAFFQQLRRTYWGSFGYMHLLVDGRVVGALWLVAGIGGAAFAGWLVAHRRDRAVLEVWAVAGVAVAATLVLFLRYSVLIGGVGHGRFFVALMPIVNGAVVVGLSKLANARVSPGPTMYATAMFAFGLLAPFLVILPAYRPPIASAHERAAASAKRLQFGDQLSLLPGTSPDVIAPGAMGELALVWQRIQPIRSDVRFRLRVVARDGTTFFDKELWPAGGGIPAYTWPAGAAYRDEVQIPVPADVTPGIARAWVSVRASNGDWLESDGTREVEVGRLAIATVDAVPSVPPETTPVSATFADQIDLVADQIGAAHPGQPLRVALYWKARATLREDATVSVQLLDAAGQLIAQNDSEPARGRAPTTTWPVGEVIVDEHDIVLPADLAAGDYRLIVVLYTHPSLNRLDVTSGDVTADHLDLTVLRYSRR